MPCTYMTWSCDLRLEQEAWRVHILASEPVMRIRLTRPISDAGKATGLQEGDLDKIYNRLVRII